MKVNSTHQTLQVEGSLASRKVGFSEENLGEISKLLRDQIYTNKVLASIRETLCNAVDEHIKHDVKVKVDVRVPNLNDQTFSVRDYGLGLSEKDVFEVFFQYFASTKRKDLLSIGGFGIGSKAPFAVATTMNVTSWFGGKKSLYVGVNTGGDCEAHLACVEDSDEPTGIEVSFDVGDRWTEFSREFCSFYSYFQHFHEVNLLTPLAITPADFTNLKKGWINETVSVKCAPGLQVYHKGVIYGVNFPINARQYVLINAPENVRLDIHRSREVLEDTPHNRAVIKQLFDAQVNKLGEELVKASPDKFGDRAEYVSQNARNIRLAQNHATHAKLKDPSFYFYGNEKWGTFYSVSERADGNYTIRHDLRYATSRISKGSLVIRIEDKLTNSYLRGIRAAQKDLSFGYHGCSAIFVQATDDQWALMAKEFEKESFGASEIMIDHRATPPVIRAPEKRDPLAENTFTDIVVGCRDDFDFDKVEYYVPTNAFAIVPLDKYDVNELQSAVSKIGMHTQIKFDKKKNPYRSRLRIAAVPKTRMKSVPSHWVNVLTLVKAMRRHSHKAVDWQASLRKQSPLPHQLTEFFFANKRDRGNCKSWPFTVKDVKPTKETQEHNNLVDKLVDLKDNSLTFRALISHALYNSGADSRENIAKEIKKLL